MCPKRQSWATEPDSQLTDNYKNPLACSKILRATAQYRFCNHNSTAGERNMEKYMEKYPIALILQRCEGRKIHTTYTLHYEWTVIRHNHIPQLANNQPSASAFSTKNLLSFALFPVLAECKSQATVTAGKFHFFAASYLEPSASLTTRWVLANMPFFALAFRTKNSWTLKSD